MGIVGILGIKTSMPIFVPGDDDSGEKNIGRVGCLEKYDYFCSANGLMRSAESKTI